MPRYDYRCPGCGLIREVERPMSDTRPVIACYSCDMVAERVYTPTAAKVSGGTPVHHDRAWVRGPGGQGNSIRRRP